MNDLEKLLEQIGREDMVPKRTGLDWFIRICFWVAVLAIAVAVYVFFL